MNRRFWIAALAALLASAAGLAQAQGFPNKPIKVVVPSPPGGPPDLILRAIIPKMTAALGQPIVVENRAGAGGLIGTAFVAGQPADGYTWLFTTASHVNIPPFNENAKYDPVKDFTHVTLAAQNFGQALVVNPELPAKSVQELIALAKKSPGKLTYGNAGDGTASHIPAEVMKSMAGLDILSIPYKGVAEATTDVMAGRIDMFFVGTQIAVQHVQSGRLRALALTGSKRWKGMPDVPTMDEQGLKGFNKVNWFGLWLPAGAAPDIVNRIHAAVATAVNDPEVKQQFDGLGLEGVAMPPAPFARFVADEARAAQDIARSIKK
ncbi:MULTISPECIES: tripartite tricarboxylate transporter substrate binding protein [Ramlibacter]|uniref:Tripartite tricarboxylate transporter substrate binding protein n=1 Tax=Ramlibacter pinisoli TaxID=2682844 RepID=A0A6N8IYB8_9BURK|nr:MULTISPECIES: tripartite tricarboxylate transporter substrate binding protein [Ramlibacter]MBA2961096.1 tripartite tricarboxylate transporter substrate binding protein [Ramlibacter sp. CGMCC 1.13660]MVQ31040.1 tripartite tricarboxylate transporter substrate binding protein [Ramlibacter pinisoli]